MTKQRERFQGPYVVDRRVHANAYQLRGLPPNVPKTQIVKFLRRFYPSPVQFHTRPANEYAAPVITPEGEIEWEVERILDHRVTRTGWSYKVKWANSSQTQWLRDEHLLNCIDLLRCYHGEKGHRRTRLFAGGIRETKTAGRDGVL